jgi:MoxR-like ATPase
MKGSTARLEALLQQEIGKSVSGGAGAIRALAIACVCRGHVLLQGAPGLGKTLLAKSFAAAIGGDFRRIQGTSDLMPTDIIGVHVYDERSREFTFRPGPLFADVVLVDEINRVGPRTQSALLEAMEERQVSAENQRLALPAGFTVIATQNPREFEGTFPLPESQLDRFLLRVEVPYPPRAAERQVLQRQGASFEATAAAGGPALAVVDAALLEGARAEAGALHVSDALADYVLDLAAASRSHAALALGISTRGAVALLRAARVAAALRSADFVTPDDLRSVAQAVLAHRLALTGEAELDGASEARVLADLLAQVPVPR